MGMRASIPQQAPPGGPLWGPFVVVLVLVLVLVLGTSADLPVGRRSPDLSRCDPRGPRVRVRVRVRVRRESDVVSGLLLAAAGGAGGPATGGGAAGAAEAVAGAALRALHLLELLGLVVADEGADLLVGLVAQRAHGLRDLVAGELPGL